jgi:hypothetical protein
MHIAPTALVCNRCADLANRVIGEDREMPGLSLSHSQACRLWGLDPETCARVLAHMVEQNVLRRTHRGAFVLC